MTDTSTPYFLADPYTEVTFLEAPEAPTVVSAFADFPMADMASAFDSTFSALFPVLSAHGVQPVGPAFSLQTRMPSETVDMEIGFPVDLALAEAVPTEAGLTLQPSRLPAGRVAIVSHLGSYDGLGAAWGAFMQAVAEAGHEPVLPFWEFYVTEPSPEADPASMRTDLITLIN
ncbi:MAG: GyrI-like domain-containing protein [Citricoccus sp.]